MSTLDDDLAVEVAEHLDECPTCANKAELADPLASVLAAVEPIPVPEGLVEDILCDLPSDSPAPWMRTADALVVSLLLAAAGLLFVVAASPGQFLADASLSSAGSGAYTITDLGRVTVVGMTTLAASFFTSLALLLVWRRWRSRR